MLTDDDRQVLADVERRLEDGIALLRWMTERGGGWSAAFTPERTFNQSRRTEGFFDEVELNGRVWPVMGVNDDIPYDHAKEAPPPKVRDEFREFVLRYFLRVSDFREPGMSVIDGRERRRQTLGDVSRGWCDGGVSTGGFGYSQLYYKERSTGVVKKFPPQEEFAIVDLRDIGARYQWVVLKVRILDFEIAFRPFGPRLPVITLPVQQETLLVLSRDFIVNEDNPEEGVLGRYGFGYVFLKDPARGGPLAYGPGRFDLGVQLIRFAVTDAGAINAELQFVVSRPRQILNVSLNPLDWAVPLLQPLARMGGTAGGAPTTERRRGSSDAQESGFDPIGASIDFINAATGGWAGDELCVAREALERDFLLQHSLQHYRMLTGSLMTWRRVPNWLDLDHVPGWAITGVSS